jgi:hypothetical protein
MTLTNPRDKAAYRRLRFGDCEYVLASYYRLDYSALAEALLPLLDNDFDRWKMQTFFYAASRPEARPRDPVQEPLQRELFTD